MTKPNRKKDRRIRRTRRELQQALRELIQTKPYHKITKVDISNQAGVSRATFYSHYPSINDLLIQCCVSVADDVADHLEQEGKTYISLPDLTLMMFNGVLDNRPLYDELQDETVLSAVMGQLAQSMIPIIQTTLSHTIEGDLHPMIPYLVANALSGSVKFWIENDFEPTSTAMVGITFELLHTTVPKVIPS